MKVSIGFTFAAGRLPKRSAMAGDCRL